MVRLACFLRSDCREATARTRRRRERVWLGGTFHLSLRSGDCGGKCGGEESAVLTGEPGRLANAICGLEVGGARPASV